MDTGMATMKSGMTGNANRSAQKRTFYDRYIKRMLDIVFALAGMILLSPLFLGITIAILLDDFGPPVFRQERIGIYKTRFTMHKFRSMRMSAPRDMPTHLLEDPEQYMTRVGRFLRKYSLDELPQLYDVFRGKLSLVGPRCALWNQDDLVSERDRYGANDIRPGLTGWAQINGRDMLDIKEKARLDGYYTQRLMESAISGLRIDTLCFIGTFRKVISSDGVVEGKTGP